MNKKRGGIEYLSALMLISLSGIILLYGISVKELKLHQQILRDGLDGACLAAALIDRNEYASTQQILIDDYYKVRSIFCETLKNNVGLNDEYEAKQESAIYDVINIEAFYVYNIKDGYLYTYTGKGEGDYDLKIDTFTGNEKTPDGTVIQSGTIYADIGVNISSYFGVSNYVHIESSVDVVKN